MVICSSGVFEAGHENNGLKEIFIVCYCRSINHYW